MQKNKRTLYVIGGKARVGKDEAAQRLRELRLVGVIISTDSLRSGEADPDIAAWSRCLDIIRSMENIEFDCGIAVAGIAATPERVHELERTLKSFIVKAMFIGYGNESYVDAILEHAENHKETDYIYWEEIRRKNAGEKTHREAMPGEVAGCEDLKRRSEKYGYEYYGAIKQRTIEEHIGIVIDKLFKNPA